VSKVDFVLEVNDNNSAANMIVSHKEFEENKDGRE